MATTKRTTKPAAVKVADDAPKSPKVIGVTSGVMAPGAVGRAAREAAHRQYASGGMPPEKTPDRPRDR